jgi:hypothetical protein
MMRPLSETSRHDANQAGEPIAGWRPALDGGRSHTADPTGKVQLTLSLSGSKEVLTALYGELRKPRSELQRAGVSILLEQHWTEVEDAFNKVGEVFNQFEAEYYVLQQNLSF